MTAEPAYLGSAIAAELKAVRSFERVLSALAHRGVDRSLLVSLVNAGRAGRESAAALLEDFRARHRYAARSGERVCPSGAHGPGPCAACGAVV